MSASSNDLPTEANAGDAELQNRELFLGCPVWACGGWVGSLYSSTKRRNWLGEYSQVFNTVEGNSTFYAMPTIETVSRWADETEAGFRFALKVPRVITHDARLQFCDDETKLFLDALAVLQKKARLGPTIIQLPPSFSGRDYKVLELFLRQLPSEMPFSVEVRHLDYFNHAPHDDQLNELLFELGMDRCVFDSRALYSAPPSDEYEKESQNRKPNLPVRPIAIGERPMVRFVGRNRVADVQPWIDEWVPVVAEWIERGKTPYVFTHSPNDEFAPEFARRFHAEVLAIRPTIGELPEAWPGEKVKKQQELF